jgi:hypothetical protein
VKQDLLGHLLNNNFIAWRRTTAADQEQPMPPQPHADSGGFVVLGYLANMTRGSARRHTTVLERLGICFAGAVAGAAVCFLFDWLLGGHASVTFAVVFGVAMFVYFFASITRRERRQVGVER